VPELQTFIAMRERKIAREFFDTLTDTQKEALAIDLQSPAIRHLADIADDWLQQQEPR